MVLIDNEHPYYQLTPDSILDAIQSVGIDAEASLLTLNSYENRVYRFHDYSQKWVVKFYRPNRWSDEQILEEHQFLRELLDAEIPVVVPISVSNSTLLTFKDYRFAIFPCVGGRDPQLENKEVLKRMGRLLARIHNVGALKPFHYRNQINVKVFGSDNVKFLADNSYIPEYLRDSYFVITGQLLDICQQQLPKKGDYQPIRIHGDCHPGNILWSDHGPTFVDLDDCIMGPEIQDLWMLLPPNSNEQPFLKEALLEGYQEFRTLDFKQWLWIEPLRTLRMIHYSAWLAKRWQDPAFKHHFPWFGEPQYWEQQILDLKEQLSIMMDKNSFGYFQ